MSRILIADAGSSKTDWVFLSDGKVRFRTKTPGINPAQQDESEIIDILLKVNEDKSEIYPDKIRFFGAGVVSPQHKELLADAFHKIWKCDDIVVDSDIIAASLALWGKNEGIVAILGTGSNSCVFKNGRIIAQIPSLGFVLGDEGSGNALGKSLLNKVFKGNLSPELLKIFHETYSLDLHQLIKRVYKEPFPAPFIASFAPFILENIQFPELQLIVEMEFQKFFVNNILPYKDSLSLPIGFVGSIAFQFKAFLEKTAALYNLKISKILKEPLPSLEIYFSENE